MKELMNIIKMAASATGLDALRLIRPEDFELQVECALIDVEVYEAQKMRKSMSRIADTLGSQATGRDGSNWRNVAFNLDPSTGNSGRVSRSYNR
jgi:hypothetical protein